MTIFAPASIKNALDAVAAEYRTASSARVALSYAASPALARQIEQGAPADIFISADLDWMDHLQRRGEIRPQTRQNLVGNRLVVIAPADAAKPVELKPGRLRSALSDGGRLALASVSTVPAGKYAKRALETLGLWRDVSDRLAEAENVRAALAFVARGEAPLGVVYETDANADPKVAIVARLPETSHPPIVYPAAITTMSRSPHAASFLAFLKSPRAAAIFSREGFVALD